MGHYHHLSIDERETILFLLGKGESIRKIALFLRRSVSTISRELQRNAKKGVYSPAVAECAYQNRRKNSCPKKRLAVHAAKAKVQQLILERHWSPEQIANRLRYEGNSLFVSYSTIYRAIYSGMLEVRRLSHGERGIARKLRHRGKTRRKKGTVETRGKIKISNHILKRPLHLIGVKSSPFTRKLPKHWTAFLSFFLTRTLLGNAAPTKTQTD